MTVKINIAQACPALLLAVRDALHLEPCRRGFGCLRANRRENVREFIRKCWQLVPVQDQPSAADRLNIFRFAGSLKLYPAMTWSSFLRHFDGKLFSGMLADMYDDWLASHHHLRPSKTIFWMIHAPIPLSLEVTGYILQPVSILAKNEIAQLLLTELHRACCTTRFVLRDFRRQMLEIQFTADSPPELRPLELPSPLLVR